jgi:hypothetical protein
VPVVNLPFAVGSDDFSGSPSLPPSPLSTLAVNTYAHVTPTRPIGEAVMTPTGGLSDYLPVSGVPEPEFKTGGSTHARVQGSITLSTDKYQWALFVADGKLYAMCDRDEITRYIYTIGDVGTATTNVSMASNGTDVVVCNDGEGYWYRVPSDTSVDAVVDVDPSIYNPSTTLLRNIGDDDADFLANGAPLYVTAIDGYYVWATDEKKIIVSALNDGRTYNALDFASAEYDNDRIVAVFRVKNQLHVAGTSTIETFDNIGGSGFPFQRTGVFHDVGVLAPHSVQQLDDGIYFVGGTKNRQPSLYSLDGSGGLQRVDDLYTQNLLSDLMAPYSGLLNVSLSAFSYSESGHVFYGLRSELDSTEAFVYDITTGLWHTRNNYPVRSTIKFRSAIVCLVSGSTSYSPVAVNSGTIQEAYGTADSYLDREIILPVMHNELERFSIAWMELTLEYGSSASSDDDLTVELFYRRDARDNTFAWRSCGTVTMVGADQPQRVRFIWRRLGRFERYAQFKLEARLPDGSSKASRRLIALRAEVTP